MLDAQHGPQDIELKNAKELIRIQHVIGAHSPATPCVGNTAIQFSGRLQGAPHDLGDAVFLGHIRHGCLHRTPATGGR
jgi:hypothetical protein